MPFGKEKLEWCGYPVVKNFEDMFSRFDRMYNTRTDGQTDTAWRHRARLHSIAQQKSDSYRLFTIIGHWDTRWWKKWRPFRKAAFSFSGWIGLLKTWRVKTIGNRRKINAIWWNVKINLQKSVYIMWILIANKFTKFHTKRLNRSENIPKSFRGGATFF